MDYSQIDRIVGAPRHPTGHYGRADSAEQTVYILHSQECLDSGRDLRKCPYSVALDRGIDSDITTRAAWRRLQDRPVPLAIFRGYLVPELYAVKEAKAVTVSERVEGEAAVSDNVIQLRPDGGNNRCECGDEWVDAKIVVDHGGKVVARTTEATCSSCGLARTLPIGDSDV